MAQYAAVIPGLAKLVMDGIGKPAQRSDGVLALLACVIIAAASADVDSLLSQQVCPLPHPDQTNMPPPLVMSLRLSWMTFSMQVPSATA